MIIHPKFVCVLTLFWVGSVSTRVTAQDYSPPSTGNVIGITILVDFNDVVETNSPQDVNTYLNSTTASMWGNNGSVRDYFEDVSNGMLVYTNWVSPAYYRAHNPIASYDAKELAHECLQDLEGTGFDFSRFDDNNDGYVDAVSILYAGTSDLNPKLSANCWPTTFVTDDGVTVNRFIIVAIGNGLKLSPFCHETGHMICGFPDLYASQGGDVGSYCLMARGGSLDGGNNVSHFCAPLKIIAGWMTVTDLVTPQADIPVTIETNECYRFAHPSDPNESFIIYNRQQVNRDAALPDGGLTIWHVHWEQDEHPKVTMEAYGNVFKKAGNYEEFSMFTNPNSDFWDGTPSGLYIHSISAAGPTMTFSFGDIGDLQVSDPAGFTTGTTEGIYPAQTFFTFYLENTGSTSLDWAAVTWAHWVDLSNIGGTLEPGGMDTVTVTLNAYALNLVGGVWDANIKFADTTNGIRCVRRVRMNVTALERLGHWKFDESTGATVAQDSSGLNHDADLKGGPEYTNGIFGNALRIASLAQYAEISGLDQIRDRMTITGWIKRNGDQSSAAGIFFNRYGINWNYGSGLNFGMDNKLGYAWAGALETWNFDSNLFVPDGQWVFAALTVEPNEAILYMHDGTMMQSAVNSVAHSPASFTDKTYVGKDPYWAGGRNFLGDIDDFQVFNFVLTEMQLECVRLGGMPTLPNPHNRQEIRATEQLLTWEAGPMADSHNVYFGTSLTTVLNADTNAVEFKGNQTDTFYDTGTLQLNKTYFWRIDPIVGGTTYPGLLWSFQPVTLRVPRDFTSIQAAIDAAVSGQDQIQVAPGTYYETIDLKGKAIRLYSSNGPEYTTINGTGNYHVVQFITGEGRDTILEGFTITGGNATGVSFPDNSGGGIFCFVSSPKISKCIIRNNQAIAGGGIYSQNSNPLIANCIIKQNVAGSTGGGMYFLLYYPVVVNCQITHNTAANGGGILSNYSQPTITNSTFYANTATTNPGGALASFASDVSNTPFIVNCILWMNLPLEIAYSPFVPIVYHSDIRGGVWPLEGNISVDPYFVNATAGNLQLSPASPCIDLGYNATDIDVIAPGVQTLPETDLKGHPRILDGECNGTDVVDMGAHEFNYAYIGDFDYNCNVDFFDFSILALALMTQEGKPGWNWVCDISDPPENYIDWRDVAILCENWLAHIP